ncbi:hypothetical protein TI05_13950, partial [Achromatium sp. WMS3]
MHLLKWQYEPQRRSKSWHVTIVTQRSNITEILEDSPGLKSLIQIVIATAYPKARKEAAAETGLQLAIFPVICPWNFEQIINDDFWPE